MDVAHTNNNSGSGKSGPAKSSYFRPNGYYGRGHGRYGCGRGQACGSRGAPSGSLGTLPTVGGYFWWGQGRQFD